MLKTFRGSIHQIWGLSIPPRIRHYTIYWEFPKSIHQRKEPLSCIISSKDNGSLLFFRLVARCIDSFAASPSVAGFSGRLAFEIASLLSLL